MTVIFMCVGITYILISNANVAKTDEWIDTSNETLMDLRFSNFTTLEQANWVEYPTVQFLNASHSSIETIGILESETIQEIDVSYGQLRWVRSGSFRHVKQLEKLFLHHNRHLTTIDLDAATLAYLDASHCSLSEASFNHVPNLRVLVLSHNRIKTIGDHDLADNVYLADVDFSYNEIESIADYAFIKLSRLERVNLTRNKVFTTDWTMTLKSVKNLEIAFNEIDTIDMMMLKQTQVLNISHNKLTQLPEELGRLLPDLELLDATANPIRQIQRIKAKKLRKVLLSQCRINEIRRNAFLETNLKFIDVSDNKLRQWDFIQSLTNASILLDDNPWSCECNVTVRLDIICQPLNISFSEFCANGVNLSDDPWFVEVANPIIWAPLIVALVIIVVACIGLRTYKKKMQNRDQDDYKFIPIPIDLIQNLPEENLSKLRQFLQETAPMSSSQQHSSKPVSGQDITISTIR